MEEDTWVAVFGADTVEKEDVKRWDHDKRSFAVFRTSNDEYYITDDICTHEYAHISDGYVSGKTVECPRHAASFDIVTGEALNPPACIDLKTYAVMVEQGTIYVQFK